MIKTVIFDIDNTLYNFDAAHEAGMEAVCNYVKVCGTITPFLRPTIRKIGYRRSGSAQKH